MDFAAVINVGAGLVDDTVARANDMWSSAAIVAYDVPLATKKNCPRGVVVVHDEDVEKECHAMWQEKVRRTY